MNQILCIRKRETVSYSQHVNILDLVYQKERNCVMPTVCLCSRLCLSKRGNLHTYNIFTFQIVCIRMRETASYQQYIYVLQFVYQEGETASYLLYVYVLVYVYQKGETVSYLQYAYVLDFVYQKEGNCLIHTVCL